MDYRDFEYPPHYDSKDLKFREDKQVYFTPSIEGDILSTDYAYVIRTLNPFYPDKYVFIFVGSYTLGTHGAALWATQSKNLAWLLLSLFRQRLIEIICPLLSFIGMLFQCVDQNEREHYKHKIGSCSKSDSVEVVLRIPAAWPFSKVGIPAVGNIVVCNHEGKIRPYYFHTPDNYADLYVRAFARMNDEAPLS